MKISTGKVTELAEDLGFDIIGFSAAALLNDEIKHLEDWLDKKYNASMEYMAKNIEKRKDVRNILPDAKSVISLGINYYNDAGFTDRKDYGKISRYAWGRDYHYVIWDKLKTLIYQLNNIDPEFKAIEYVDTGPVMDKAWAVRGGLGWLGKNSNVISKKIGSWFFIATVITNYEFEPSAVIPDHCGTCRACIDACPTGAIIKDKVIDANKCISFLTIENKNDISEEFKGKFDRWIFGCDICQEVCPWNISYEMQTKEEDFINNIIKEMNLDSAVGMTDSEFKEKFGSSPVYRAKLKGIKRNAEFLKDTANSIDKDK